MGTVNAASPRRIVRTALPWSSSGLEVVLSRIRLLHILRGVELLLRRSLCQLLHGVLLLLELLRLLVLVHSNLFNLLVVLPLSMHSLLVLLKMLLLVWVLVLGLVLELLIR